MKPRDFIKEEHNLVQAATEMHTDHEIQMAREACYRSASNAIELHRMLKHISEQEGLEAWASEKISLANDYLRTVKEWLEYELMSRLEGHVAENNMEISEATKETTTGRVHKAEPGGYGRRDDDDGKKKEKAAEPVKRGRGRPKKDADSETGEVKNWDTDTLQSWIVGSVPKKLPGKASVKHKIKDESANLSENEFQDQFSSFLSDFKRKRGIGGGASAAAPTRSAAPVPAADTEQMMARLKELQARFDPAYEYSDDHSFWSEQNEIAKEIRSIKRALSQQGVAEGYSLKKTNVDKYIKPGDPDEYTQDINIKDTDYEIINNKTGQVVGTASWTTNDYFGPGALKITMRNGATRYLDIWASEKGNPQTAFNRFVKDPKTAKKYKEQGVAEGDGSWKNLGLSGEVNPQMGPRLKEIRDFVERFALHNQKNDYIDMITDLAGFKNLGDMLRKSDGSIDNTTYNEIERMTSELERLGFTIASDWKNEKYMEEPRISEFAKIKKEWYLLFKKAINFATTYQTQQGVAEGSEDLRAKLDLYNEKAFEAGHRHDDQAWRKYTKLAKQIADQLGLKYKVTGYGLEIIEQGVAEGLPGSSQIYDQIESLSDKLKHTSDPDKRRFYIKQIKNLEHKLHSTYDPFDIDDPAPIGKKGVAEGYREYDELRDRIDHILIKAYNKYGTRDEIIDAAKPAAMKAARELGAEKYFDEVWMDALASHDVDTDFGDNDDDFDYTDYSMRKGERGMAEGTKETSTGRVHKAEPGGYGRRDDDDGKKKEKTAEPVKRGRGRPKKDADSETGEVKNWDTDTLQRWIVGSVPKKLPGKANVKHKIKDEPDEKMDESMRRKQTKEMASAGASSAGAMAVAPMTAKKKIIKR